jgi:hypothetical protein
MSSAEAKSVLPDREFGKDDGEQDEVLMTNAVRYLQPHCCLLCALPAGQQPSLFLAPTRPELGEINSP